MSFAGEDLRNAPKAVIIAIVRTVSHDQFAGRYGYTPRPPHYGYTWADGIYFNIHTDERPWMLVVSRLLPLVPLFLHPLNALE